MKTLLIPIILLFASCSKMEEIVPEHPKNVMIEVQAKNASAVVIVNDDAKSIQCDNDHCVQRFWKRLQATQFYEAIELCLAVNVWCFIESVSSLKY